MFVRIARFDIRFRWLIVAAWLLAVAVVPRLLPSLGSQTANPSDLLQYAGQDRHEGHNGYRIQEIADNLDGENSRPDNNGGRD